MKSITFHSKALVFIRGQSPAIKQEIGEALRDVQKGIRLGLPLSRPMPEVASGAHELRVRGLTTTVRVFYFVTLTDGGDTEQVAEKLGLYINHRNSGCSKRLSSKAAASEEARRTLRYVEPLSDARTPLADFFSILLSMKSLLPDND